MTGILLNYSADEHYGNAKVNRFYKKNNSVGGNFVIFC